MTKKEIPIIFKFLESINNTKVDIMNDGNEKDYVPYVINKFLSGTIDTIFLANEMNERRFLDKRLQYDFLRAKVRKRYRRTKWIKRDDTKDIEIIKKYYDYNTHRAMEVMKILDKDDIKEIKKLLSIGGLSDK